MLSVFPALSGEFILRPIRPDEGEELQAYFRRLSPQARYFRLLGGASELPASELARAGGRRRRDADAAIRASHERRRGCRRRGARGLCAHGRGRIRDVDCGGLATARPRRGFAGGHRTAGGRERGRLFVRRRAARQCRDDRTRARAGVSAGGGAGSAARAGAKAGRERAGGAGAGSGFGWLFVTTL
jgi:hypothetical protein